MREPRPQESRDSLQFAVLCETALGDGLRVRFRADGRSMQPNVLDGDTVVVAPISAGRPGRGDIALTRGEQGFVLHRVVGWDPATGAIVTRGDAGQQNDAPAEKLLGKVIAIERGGRTISTLAPGTTLLHRFRTQMHRSVRAGARRADRFRTALAPVAFMLFAVLLHASPAAAQATLTITDGAAPNPVASGANITYTQVVANTSGNAATGAKLTQNTPANTVFESVTPPTGWTCGTTPAVGGTGAITCTDATVAANSSGTFTVVVEASPEATGGSTITDTVTVSWTGPRGGGSNVGSASVTVTGADISMTQTVAPATVAPGGTITYTESVTNNGPNTASGVTLYQQTPTNTTFASITAAAGWTCTSPAVGATGQVTCTIASLNSGTSSGNFTYVVTVGASVAAGTTIVNTADANSGTSDPVSSNNATTTSVLVEAAADADMAVSMQASPSPVYVSSPITYTIQVSNLGLSSASAVSVVDTLPSTLAGASATTSSGSCGAPTGGTITCSLGTVASGAGPITISVTGTSPGTAGTLTNSAKVSSTTTDPVSSNNTATVVTVVQPLVCGTPGKDGAGGTLTGVVNTYYAGTGTPAAGATSITVTTPSSGSATQIGVNDLLLVIQMQGAQINSTNTSSYGDGVAGDPASGSTSLGNSGQFEFVTVTAVAAGTGTETLTIQGSGAGAGLLNSYASVAASNTSSPPQGIQTFQVIRVPQYSSATLSSTLAALAWNGSVGGVLALDVSAQLTLNGTVVLDGQGFRGGGGASLAGATGLLSTDVVTLSTQAANGSKGEGIAGTPHYVAPSVASITPATTATSTAQTYLEGLPNGSYARGAPGNAAGGATDANPTSNNQNSGGGGGANGGTGGIGGFGWDSAGIVGGFGGVAFPASTAAVVMGGGGGAGTTNDGSYWNPTTNAGNADCGANCTGIYSSGVAGGGIVIIHAGAFTGTGTITANGQNALETENDGGGGGGAGGSILVSANSGGLTGLTASADGGNGGVTWPEQAAGTPFPGNRHGPGGGGGGGVIMTTSAPAGASVTGGNAGWSTLADDAYGATAGQSGVFTSGLANSTTPGTQSGASCAGADLAVTNAGTPNPVVPGNNITYTQTVTNNGPLAAVNASMTEVIPMNTTFQSIAITGAGAAGWSCATPAVGATGVITCTNASVPSGASGAATFTVAVQVNIATTSGTQITDTLSATSGTSDPNLANNSATVLTIVGAATTANLAITNAGTPNPVLAGNNITYTVTVTNNGPAASSTVAFTEAVPTNTTFVSVGATSGTGGWTCSATAISCSIPTLAAGASTTFTVVVTVGAGTASGTVITDTANVSAATTDPNPTNNVATVTTTVATAGQADLAVTKTGTPNPVLAGNNITYTITVTNNGPAAAANVTLTDTLPANTTVVSISTPAGWTCPAASGGTQTCTNASVAANATATFTLIVKVTAGTAPGTVIKNTASVASSTTTDPNSANNTASSSSTVASPSQADVAIVKTASPEPVNQNTNLTYTLQVTNNGPAVAQGVTVTDVLPAQVTYTSVSVPASQGSCTYTAATTTVNCSLGSISVGGLVIITINVNAATFSSATTSSNTATVTASTTDPNMTNNSSTAVSTIQAATAVDLTSFKAETIPGGGTLLEWQTREESRNLGFHLYREDARGRHQIDPSLIAGSALLFRGGQPQHRAKSYQWIDAQGGSQASYWIEDVDLNGTRTLHGPIYAELASPGSQPVSQARTLGQMSQSLALAAPAVRAAVQVARGLATPHLLTPLVPPEESSASLNGEPAVKISVTSEGWYQVTRNQLVAAGLPAGADARLLQLYAEGVEQPLLIIGKQYGPLGPNDSIEFYGTGIDTPFSGTRVYWLVRGSRPGTRISSVSSPGSGPASASSFPFTVLFEQRTTYFAALLNGVNNDNFFGAIVTSAPVDQVINVAHIDPTSALPVTMDVTLQGVTDQQPHSVSISFNGAPVGEMDFANQANVTNTFAINSSLLANGANTVTLTALDGDNDVNLVQSIALHYAHTYAADSDWLSATASTGNTVHIDGFANGQIQVMDITNPLEITQLTGAVASDGSGFGITLAIPGSPGTERTLLAFSNDQISVPAALSFHAPSSLERPQPSADLVVIAYPDFAASVAPLVKLHETKGDSVSVVTTDQVFDAFNFGERSPFALQSYLQLLATSWHTRPQAVLLVGGASFDPRNYLGFGDTDFVPSRMIETAAFKTASDDWLTDFKQTGFATIPTGRLPVNTPAETDLVVSKIVGYEQGGGAGSWNEQALVIADQNIGVDFTTEANSAAADLPASLATTKILADGQDPTVIKQQILAALNSGALVVNYTGHGSEEQWSFSDLLDDTSATSLSNGDRLPVYLLMDCLNGFFQDVYDTALSTSLMLAPNGGAVAVWASSGFTNAPPQATMDQALLGEWKVNPALPIGKAILTAKAGIVDPDVRRTWNLFGDPMMQLQLPSTGQGQSSGSRRPSH